MYDIDQHDKVVLLEGLPQPDVGAPVPALIANETRVELAFVARPREPSAQIHCGGEVREPVRPHVRAAQR
jgi:hypothetical protein